MLKFKIDHIDEFGKGDYICWVLAKNIPSKYIEIAKEIDKEDYSEDCFGVCVNSENYNFNICQENVGCELYYIDNDGDKYWMDYLLTIEERKSAIKLCKEKLNIR